MTYKYLFDTNIVSHNMQGNGEKLSKQLGSNNWGQININLSFVSQLFEQFINSLK